MKLGYTHALQVDGDNQHNTDAIKVFLSKAESFPDRLINSYPVYDASAQAIRQHGRKLTNFWVRLETRSDAIRDAMCGFRVYPLKEIAPLLDKIHFKRMGFDIEIIVKAYWQGIDIINLPVDVRYPDGGHSNYKLFADNVKISFLHAYLFCSSFFAGKRRKREEKAG